MPKEVEVVMRDWRTFALFDNELSGSESTKDKVGSLLAASQDYVMLFAIFLKS